LYNQALGQANNSGGLWSCASRFGANGRPRCDEVDHPPLTVTPSWQRVETYAVRLWSRQWKKLRWRPSF